MNDELRAQAAVNFCFRLFFCEWLCIMSKKGHILNMVMLSTLLSLLANQLHPPAAGEGQRGHQSKEGPKVTVALK